MVPGGTNQLEDDVVLDVPTDRVLIADRWQQNLGPSPQPWRAAHLGWTGGMGDFTADGLRAGYFGAYRASTGEGVHREFDPKATPGLDTWAYGFHPPAGVVPMGSGAPSNGYFEMWGGNVRTFPDERASLAAAPRRCGPSIRPFSSTRDRAHQVFRVV